MKYRCTAYLFISLLLSGIISSGSSAGAAADSNPLRPPDTSSPRESLRNFETNIDGAYLGMRDLLMSYFHSGRLYLNADERRIQAELIPSAKEAIRSFDFSGVLPILQNTIPIERALQLKEILARIEIPAFDDIPDRDAMARMSVKTWRLPNTEIDFVLIEDGPRAGDYVVSTATVDRLPKFYDRIKHLPYKVGPAKELNDLYREVSSDGDATIYDMFASAPVGLDRIVPTRWMLRLPHWAQFRIGGPAVWQWLCFSSGLLVAGLFVFGVHRLAYRLARSREDGSGPFWPALLTPLALILIAALVIPLLCAILRISGQPAGSARDSLLWYCDRHRVPDPGRRQPWISGLLGYRRTGRRRARRGACGSRQSREFVRLDADHVRKAIPGRRYDQDRRKRGHRPGCRVPKHPHPYLGQFIGLDSE
jgi:MscS family membrane protein